jgi:uncharacterized protein (TIGR02453 family)
MPTTTDTQFMGFGTDGLAVLSGLRSNNTREFFEANRAVFERDVLEPAKLLVDDLGQRLRATVAPNLVADPRVDRSLFRLHRDVRFSADKSPYKTQQAMFLWEGADKKVSPGFYLAVSGDEVGLGVGLMHIADLDRWRAAIADDVTGQAFTSALRRAETERNAMVDLEPALKRVPKPYPPDHPRERWLRHKGFRAANNVDLPPEATTPAFVDWCTTRFASFAPLHRWLVDNLVV